MFNKFYRKYVFEKKQELRKQKRIKRLSRRHWLVYKSLINRGLDSTTKKYIHEQTTLGRYLTKYKIRKRPYTYTSGTETIKAFKTEIKLEFNR